MTTYNSHLYRKLRKPPGLLLRIKVILHRMILPVIVTVSQNHDASWKSDSPITLEDEDDDNLMATHLQGMMIARLTAVTRNRIPLVTLLHNLPFLSHNNRDQLLTRHRLDVQQIDLTVIIHTLSSKVRLKLMVYILQ